MKRLRPRIFGKILGLETSSFGVEVDKCRIERLRNLIWCFNNYQSLLGPYLLYQLEKYREEVRMATPNIWLPEIKI